MSQLHLKIAQQVERGYHEKTGQWGDNEFLIDLIDGYTAITFRGTETVKLKRDLVKGGVGHFLEKAKSFVADVATDIRALPWYDRRIGWGHAGFLKAARGIVDRELSIFDMYKEPLILAGHSLGGGIAREAAQFLEAMGYCVIEVVDFGSPRSHIGETKYTPRMTSYRYGQDYVTTVPWGFVWDYQHPYESKQGRLVQLGPGYDPDGDHTWDDHPIELYIEALST